MQAVEKRETLVSKKWKTWILSTMNKNTPTPRCLSEISRPGMKK